MFFFWNLQFFVLFCFPFRSREYFRHFIWWCQKTEKGCQQNCGNPYYEWEIIGEILSGICYEQALELFLTEYPNGETPRGKCRSAGYATSSKAIAQAEKKRGLTLTMEDSDVEMNRDGENETAPSYSWRTLNWQVFQQFFVTRIGEWFKSKKFLKCKRSCDYRQTLLLIL